MSLQRKTQRAECRQKQNQTWNRRQNRKRNANTEIEETARRERSPNPDTRQVQHHTVQTARVFLQLSVPVALSRVQNQNQSHNPLLLLLPLLMWWACAMMPC